MTDDPALDTLFLPFDTEALAWPADGRALFLGARAGAALAGYASPALACEQSVRQHATALEQAGLTVSPAVEGRFPLVLVLPPRQREAARTLLARALDQAVSGAAVVVSLANTDGARSIEEDLVRLAGPVESLSKNRCRVFWVRPQDGAGDLALRAEWALLDAPRPVAEGRFLSRPGLFAWDRIDPGSALLAAHLPADLKGHGADLGSGFGTLSAAILERCPDVTALDLYDAEARALDLARRNLAPLAGQTALDFLWHDVAGGLAPGRRYHFIVTNPPFHDGGRADRHDLGRAFIAAAAAGLKPKGRLWLVANRHLPYEATLEKAFTMVRSVVEDGPYKVIEAAKGVR
ncbi:MULTISPECIES: class I SAM-dependent methyltransferase [Inquilinus]|uniref:16S rRNA (Guanine1207-N2)-methyltransferase n=1 Tax=Inquilinus ginsengisoli TaxID=363840 RepID=A0ABU1JPR4_9PROT|nr:class I SAM-dependent methyltransferase [Inquilinus ginsengisoli]MDR6290318.1 16S rRNA (guanine1207-N2)-methyltransferase [Inquilinus ginsengisoli]